MKPEDLVEKLLAENHIDPILSLAHRLAIELGVRIKDEAELKRLILALDDDDWNSIQQEDEDQAYGADEIDKLKAWASNNAPEKRKLPPVEELFRIFSKVNLDSLKTGESVVDFSDTEYYQQQISAIWDDTDDGVTDAEIEAAANQLRDFAKAQGYVLPTRKRKQP